MREFLEYVMSLLLSHLCVFLHICSVVFVSCVCVHIHLWENVSSTGGTFWSVHTVSKGCLRVKVLLLAQTLYCMWSQFTAQTLEWFVCGKNMIRP